MDPRLDRLTHILNRALRRAAFAKATRKASKAKNNDQAVSEDYANRLAEKAKFRNLLEDIRLDGLRFRYYFTKIHKSEVSLSELRAWIDSHMLKETIDEVARKGLAKVVEDGKATASAA